VLEPLQSGCVSTNALVETSLTASREAISSRAAPRLQQRGARIARGRCIGPAGKVEPAASHSSALAVGRPSARSIPCVVLPQQRRTPRGFFTVVGLRTEAPIPFHGSRFPALPARTMAQALPRRASSCESGDLQRGGSRVPFPRNRPLRRYDML
jgi:hypothetical protein